MNTKICYQEKREIPHIIHYCWFGNKTKPKDIQKYIDKWHCMLPDYSFMEWNEQNCDLDNEIPYVKEAYASKKYAFVSDYIRIKKLYEYGGIYLDTDVDIIKRFDKIIDDAQVVLGFQGVGNIGTAFIATCKNHPLFYQFLRKYEQRHFVMENGELDLTSINVSFDPLLVERGLNLSDDSYQSVEEGIVVYPTDYFCAFDLDNWHPVITKNTCTVHYMASSWKGIGFTIKASIIKIIISVLGAECYDTLRNKQRGRR